MGLSCRCFWCWAFFIVKSIIISVVCCQSSLYHMLHTRHIRSLGSPFSGSNATPLTTWTSITQTTEAVVEANSRAERLQQLNSLTYDTELARNCSDIYQNQLMNQTMQDWYLYIVDFVQGTVSCCVYIIHQ